MSGRGQNGNLNRQSRDGDLEREAGQASRRGDAAGIGKDGLTALIEAAGAPARERPVERWDPPDCGDIDMLIRADGVWVHEGSPIGREALMRLFASVLRREPDGRYVIVTPVEKLGIRVEDAPFLAVEVHVEGEREGRRLTFRTNCGDLVTAGPDHPLRFAVDPGTRGLKPYVLVRGRLEALATRSLAQELVSFAEDGRDGAGLYSGGAFFPFPGVLPDVAARP